MPRCVVALAAFLLAAYALPVAGAGGADGAGFFDAGLPVTLSGDVLARAEHGLVLGLSDGAGFRLSLDAATADVVATSIGKLVVTNPGSGGVVLEWYDDDAKRTTRSFDGAAITFDRIGSEASLLVYPTADGAPYVAEAEGFVRKAIVEAAPYAEFRTHPGPTAQNAPDEEPNYDLSLQHEMRDPHFRMDGVGLAHRVTGTFSLFLWDVDFTVTPPGGEPVSYTTGHRTGTTGPPAERQEEANAVLTLTDAVLTLEGARQGGLYAPGLAVAVTGNASLPSAVGGYADESGRYEADGSDTVVTGDLLLSFTLLRDRYDRALVSVGGDVASLSLLQAPPLDRDVFLGSPAAKAIATASGIVLLSGAVLVARRPDLLKRGRVDDAEAALLAYERGDDKGAAVLFARALRERPDDVVLLIDHGSALERLGRTAEARDAFERAVRVDPGRGEAHYYYSRALLALGLTTGALPHLQRALLLDPRLKEMARVDPGFRPLADHPVFVSLVR